MKQVQEQEQSKGQVNGLCDWCATNAGRTKKGRPCCELRQLAQSPRHAQAEYAATLTTSDRDALRPVLAAEIKRLRELRK
jgi:hypothetical protein